MLGSQIHQHALSWHLHRYFRIVRPSPRSNFRSGTALCTAEKRGQVAHVPISEGGSFLMRLKKGGNKNKAVAKGDLPSKECIVCKRPFTWRKKWEKCWDDVKYCSDRCRRSAKSTQNCTEADSPRSQDA